MSWLYRIIVRVINKSPSDIRTMLHVRIIFYRRLGVKIQFQVEKRKNVLWAES